MLLSIVMPSHGSNLLAYSRILNACALASPDVEIVVRDNSGVPEKHRFLDSLKRDHCTLVAVPECEFDENFRESLQLAKGEFVFFVSDDDVFFERAVVSILGVLKNRAGDGSLAGVTGSYVIELSDRTVFMGYQGLGSEAMAERVMGYLSFQGPNMLGYSTVRRDVAINAWEFTRAHPFTFPFHDQIVAMLYTVAGRFADIGRLIFAYDNANWETVNVAARQDLKFYSSMGMDPALGRFHWFLCAFEGAVLLLHSNYTAAHPAEQRQAAATKWFEVMFARFANDRRPGFGSHLDKQAETLCVKWKSSFPRFQLDQALEDIAAFMNLSSAENAALYRNFWRSIVAGREMALPPGH